jgi:hypothetical protein
VPDSEFVASRCAALEVWLRRLSSHPVIGHSRVRLRSLLKPASVAVGSQRAAGSPSWSGRWQELRLFLEKEGQLGSDPEWAHLQPASGGVLDGLHRLPRQLLGAPLPTESGRRRRPASRHCPCAQYV